MCVFLGSINGITENPIHADDNKMRYFKSESIKFAIDINCKHSNHNVQME